MFRKSSILGSTFFASREPVRNPKTLELLQGCRTLSTKDLSLEGSASLRLVKGLLVTSDVSFSNIKEGDIVEVTDYDPVRKTSIVIGMKEPSLYVPLHWLCFKTHPGSSVCVLVLMDTVPDGAEVFASRLLHGSFEEAMEVATQLKANGKGRIFLQDRGLLLVSKDLGSVTKELGSLLGKGKTKKRSKKRSKKRPSGRGARKEKVRKRSKPKGKGRKKTHYKRGPTRRRKRGN